MSESTPKPEVVGYRCHKHGLVGYSHACGTDLECLVLQTDYKRLQADFETLDYQYSEAINKAIPAIEDTVDHLWKALNRLLRECQWTRERNGYYVESRSGNGDGVAHMLRDAEDAHGRYVHDHGE